MGIGKQYCCGAIRSMYVLAVKTMWHVICVILHMVHVPVTVLHSRLVTVLELT